MKLSKLIIGILFPFMSVADANIDWPYPTKPNTEPDPFIRDVDTDADSTRSTTLDDNESFSDELNGPLLKNEPLFDHDPLKELPLEGDPLLRTPLDNSRLQNDPLNNVDLDDDNFDDSDNDNL